MALQFSSSGVQMPPQFRRTDHHRWQEKRAVSLRSTTSPPHIIRAPHLVKLAVLLFLLFFSFPSKTSCSFIYSTSLKNRGNLSWSAADLGEEFLHQGILQVMESGAALASSEQLVQQEHELATSALEVASNVSEATEELFEDAKEEFLHQGILQVMEPRAALASSEQQVQQDQELATSASEVASTVSEEIDELLEDANEEFDVQSEQEINELRVPSQEQEIQEVLQESANRPDEKVEQGKKVQASSEMQRRDEEKVTTTLLPLPLHRRLVLLGRTLLEFRTSIKRFLLKKPQWPVKLAEELDSKVKKGMASGLAFRFRRSCCCCLEFVSEATRRTFYSYFIAPWLPDLRKNLPRALLRVVTVLGVAALWESFWLMILEIPYDWLSMLQYENHIRLISRHNNPWTVKITFATCMFVRAFIRLFITGKWFAITTLAMWEARTSKASKRKLVTTAIYTAVLTFIPFFIIKAYEFYQFLLKHWRQTARGHLDEDPQE